MRTARSVLHFARQLATLLGPNWSAHSRGNAQAAFIEGPFTLDITTKAAPVRTSTPVTASLYVPGTLVDPTRSDHCPEVAGTVGDPQELADAVHAIGIPAWTKLLAELEQRSVRVQESLKVFVAEATQLAGPGTRASYGSRPGVADLRWAGGSAMVHINDGSVRIRYLVMEDLTANAFTEVLRATGPADDRPSSTFPPLGRTF